METWLRGLQKSSSFGHAQEGSPCASRSGQTCCSERSCSRCFCSASLPLSFCPYSVARAGEEKPLTGSVLPPSRSVMNRDPLEHILTFLQLVPRLSAAAASWERAKGRRRELGTYRGQVNIQVSSLFSYPALSEGVELLV